MLYFKLQYQSCQLSQVYELLIGQTIKRVWHGPRCDMTQQEISLKALISPELLEFPKPPVPAVPPPKLVDVAPKPPALDNLIIKCNREALLVSC